MAWKDIERWRKMTSYALIQEAGFPEDCDAIYINNCYELSYAPKGTSLKCGLYDVFQVLFQVHYETNNLPSLE